MIIRSTQVLQRPLFCNSSLFYVTLLFHLVVTGTQILYMQIIIENGSQLNNTMHCVTSVTLPDSVTIFGTRIIVYVNEVCHGELSNLTESRISLETLILRNHIGKTGFSMWISSYCIACIYQQNEKVKQLFSLITYEKSE